MTFPRFFVDRPIFAVVLSVLMLIAGGLTLLKLLGRGFGLLLHRDLDVLKARHLKRRIRL